MEQAQATNSISRRKYVFTDQIDQLIQGAYLNHQDAKTGFGIRPLAEKVAYQIGR